jgi:hypothetical protein
VKISIDIDSELDLNLLRWQYVKIFTFTNRFKKPGQHKTASDASGLDVLLA